MLIVANVKFFGLHYLLVKHENINCFSTLLARKL